MVDEALGSRMPQQLRERLERCWQASCHCGTTGAFEHELGKLCTHFELYFEDAHAVCNHGDNSVRDDCDEAEHMLDGAANMSSDSSIASLPDDVLAAILRMTLDPEHPGSLCAESYISDLRLEEHLRMESLFETVRHMRSHFSRKALLKPPPHGPVPSFIVCKRWHRIVMHGDVVRVLAVDFPAGLPSSLQTLMLRLDLVSQRPHTMASVELHRARALKSVSGVKRLREVICCFPSPRSVTTPYDPQPLGWAWDCFHPVLLRVPGLTRLEVSHCTVNMTDLHGSAFSLQNLSNLECLVLHDAGHFSGSMHVLAPCLGRLTKLVHLDLAKNALDTSDMRHLLGHVTKLTRLRTLCLEGNECHGNWHLSEEESQALVAYITELRALEHLNLHDMQFHDSISEVCLKELVSGLVALPALHTLGINVRNCVVTDEDLSALLSRITALRTLGVDLCISDTDSPDTSSSTMSTPASLQRLHLADNCCDAALNVIALRPSILRGLTALHLEAAGDRDTTVPALASLFSAVASLNELSLANSGLHERDWEALAATASNLMSLRFLDLSDTDWGWQAAAHEVMSPFLASLTGLLRLDLRGISLANEDVRQLAPVLEGMHGLQELDLRFNHIGAPGIRALGRCMHRWKSLQYLGLDYVAADSNASSNEQNQVGSASVFWLAAHVTDEERLQALAQGMNDDLKEEWRRLHAIWTCPANVSEMI